MTRFIHIRCTSCTARIKAPPQILGQTRSCPGCGQALMVQREPLEDAAPMLLEEDMPVLAGTSASGRLDEKLILVADDDRDLSDGLRTALERQGYRVIQAADGVQAKEMALQEQPDLMILDLMMPRLGGFPVLEYFQNRPKAPPIIMITAQEGNEHKVYAEHLGVVDYLRKPFSLDRLLQSVEKGLVAN